MSDLESALRGLMDALQVVDDEGIRCAGIPDLRRFWEVYDQATAALKGEQDVEMNETPTLRDRFAMAVLQGFYSNYAQTITLLKSLGNEGTNRELVQMAFEAPEDALEVRKSTKESE